MGLLVSVICTVYNQEAYVQEALQSIIDQTYPNVEVVVIDNASTDGSAQHIQAFVAEHPTFTFLPQTQNIGITGALCLGLEHIRGDWFIDLSGDDVLLPNRIEQQVAYLQIRPQDTAVLYSNAELFYPKTNRTKWFFAATEQPPVGDVYQAILRKNFLPVPTILYRTAAVREVGGFDTRLHYEDYDLLIRLARQYSFAYQPKVLTRIRKLSTSLGQSFYRKNSAVLKDTVQVILKAQRLNREAAEDRALAYSIRYHMRLALFTANYAVGLQFYQVLTQLDTRTWYDRIIWLGLQGRIPVAAFYRWYRLVR